MSIINFENYIKSNNLIKDVSNFYNYEVRENNGKFIFSMVQH
jgi:hypothetical protein